ncbi:MAG: Beta-galactosidase C-terminal domain, partial [Candidatus Acidiferrales bacterium]
FTAWLLRTTPIETQFSIVPAGVEICHRVRTASAPGGGAADVYIVINHSTHQQQLTLPDEMKDALHSGAPETSLTLAPRDVAVLSK